MFLRVSDSGVELKLHICFSYRLEVCSQAVGNVFSSVHISFSITSWARLSGAMDTAVNSADKAREWIFCLGG